MKRYITLSILALFFLGNALYPQQKSISDSLLSSLSESEIETEIQLLSGSLSGEFPYSILFSTHITSDLEKCADYITYIKDGKIIKSSDVCTFRDDYILVSGTKEKLSEEYR